MEAQQQRVKQFMEVFGQDCPDKPTPLDAETAILRAALIFEEALETIVKGLGVGIEIGNEDGKIVSFINNDNHTSLKYNFYAISPVNLTELADGVSDLSVVSYGAALAAGIDMEPVDKEVSRSNLSKAWTEEDLLMASELHPTAKKEQCGSLYRLKREDGKIIKSPSYTPAEIEKEILTQQK